MSKDHCAAFLRAVFGIVSPLFTERLFNMAKISELAETIHFKELVV
jgi:hypothetical protein